MIESTHDSWARILSYPQRGCVRFVVLYRHVCTGSLQTLAASIGHLLRKHYAVGRIFTRLKSCGSTNPAWWRHIGQLFPASSAPAFVSLRVLPTMYWKTGMDTSVMLYPSAVRCDAPGLGADEMTGCLREEI